MARTGALLLALLLVLPGVALADPPAACFPASALAARPGEIARHRPGPSDHVAIPAADAPLATQSAGPGPGVVRRVAPDGGARLVALTFDLCEGSGEVAGYDGAIVDRLRADKAAATFFMGGRWAQSHEERAMQLLADPLFEVGDHTYDHADLAHADAARITQEIARTEAVIGGLKARLAKACPAADVQQTRLFRFPYGACGADGPAVVRGAGLVPIQWDVVSGDPAGIAAAPMARAVLAEVEPGSIIVMHANGRGRHTAEALATIIPALRARGYRFVTVSALITSGRPQTSAACFVEHPGDTARYDRPKAAADKTKGAGMAPAPAAE